MNRAVLLVASLPRRLAIAAIRLYQVAISPMLGPACRFSPSCSHYAQACLRDHGLLRGSWLTLRRLSRCHPFCPGGYDPPPPALPRGRHSGHSGIPHAPPGLKIPGSGAPVAHEDVTT